MNYTDFGVYPRLVYFDLQRVYIIEEFFNIIHIYTNIHTNTYNGYICNMYNLCNCIENAHAVYSILVSL